MAESTSNNTSAQSPALKASKAKKLASAGTVPLSDIFFMTLRHWPWIILSVLICCGAAYFHLLRIPYTYTRYADILIKSEADGRSAGMEEIAQLGLKTPTSNITNEIATLTSNDMAEEVVKRLDLDMNYFKKGRFHDDVVYGKALPVKVRVIDATDDTSLSFDLDVTGGGRVTISNLVGGGSKSSKTYTGRLNDVIVTPAGKIVVSPTTAFSRNEDVELLVRKVPVSAMRNAILGSLLVANNNEKGSVLRMTVTDQSAERADDVLNTLITVYNENWIKEKNQNAVSTSNFINERLGVIEKELGSVENDISSFKSEHLMPDVNAVSSMYMNQSQTNAAEILEINNQLQMARYIRKSLLSDSNRDQMLPANSGLDGDNIQSMIQEYNSMMLERNSLLSKSSAQNPIVVSLDNQLTTLRNVMVKSIDNVIVGLNTRLKSVQNSEAKAISQLASNPNQAKYLLSVERQQKVKESLYLYLLQKREENELSQAFTAYNTRVINRPTAAAVPPTPNRQNFMLSALLIGLLIPFGVTYAFEAFNTRVRGRKDIEDLSMPFLGEIPLYGENREKRRFGKDRLIRAIVVKGGKRDIINEAFRVLRTNLEMMKIHKDEADVIAITSFNPGSGKSFIAMNLAVVLSLKGKRVLVIDGDMRHCSTSAYVNSPERGMATYLSGQENDINKLLVQDNEIGTLSVLPVGAVPPNPAELLETERFAVMVNELRKEFDYILIDCPPIEVVADAQIIDRLADRTIFVVRAGLLERSMLPQLEKLYDEKKYKNIATILNGTDLGHKGHYGYSHSYRYGYGYGYGYGYNYASDKKSTKGSKGQSTEKSDSYKRY